MNNFQVLSWPSSAQPRIYFGVDPALHGDSVAILRREQDGTTTLLEMAHNVDDAGWLRLAKRWQPTRRELRAQSQRARQASRKRKGWRAYR